MAGTDDQKPNPKRSPRRRVTNTAAPNFETPSSSRPSLQTHPYSEPALATANDLLSTGKLQVPKKNRAKNGIVAPPTNKESKKRKTPSSLDESSRSLETNAETCQGIEAVVVVEDTAPETPCPSRRSKGRRSTSASRRGRAQSDQKSVSSGRTSGAQLFQASASPDKERVMEQSYNRSPSPDGSSDHEEDDSDTASDTSSMNLKDVSDGEERSVKFEKKHPETLSRRDITSNVFDAILNNAVNPQEARRGEKGYIYILQDKHCSNYVKIGQTSKKPNKRRKEIQRCKLIRPELVGVQHYGEIWGYKRLESIIFADLWNERHYYRCYHCRKSDEPSEATSRKFTKHHEWFNIDIAQVTQRVEQWRDWMRRDPYDTHGVLKSEWRKRIEDCNKNPSYHETVDEEHASQTWWQDFMKPFPDPPSWIRRETIEARLDRNNVQWPSRVDCILDNGKELLLPVFAGYEDVDVNVNFKSSVT